MTSTLNSAAPTAASDSATNARAGSSFTALTRRVHELDLMRRRYGYYWTKLVGALVIAVIARIPRMDALEKAATTSDVAPTDATQV